MTPPVTPPPVSGTLIDDLAGSPPAAAHGNRRAACLCALAVTVCVLATVPVLEMGVNDDWSYTLTAKALAETGHLTYNGWATAMIGVQAYWAALWIKVFGFSFTLVRLTTLPFAAGSAALLYALGRRAGLAPGLAAFGSLTVTLSPVFTPLAASFMTDVPGLFFFLVCLYAADRAAQGGGSETSAAGWLCLLAAAGLLGGTVRQVDWIAPALFLPYLAWTRRGDRRFLTIAGLLWAGTVLGTLGCMHWYKHQPYAIVERPTEGLRSYLHSLPWSLFTFVPLILTALLLSLPTLLGALPAWRLRVRRQPFLFGYLVVIGVAAAVLNAPIWGAQAMAPWLGNIVTRWGVIGPWVTSLGDLPPSLPHWAWRILSMAVFGIVGVFLATAIQASEEWRETRNRKRFPYAVPLVLRLWLLYTLCYLPLLALRSSMAGAFDRYLIFIMPAILIPTLLYYQATVGERMNAVGYFLLGLFALYGIATTHDYLATERARLAAATELTAAGVPRTHIMAGLEYDGWTQIEQTGYFNDPRITNPPGAFHPRTAGRWPLTGHAYFTDQVSSIAYDYFAVLTPQPELVGTNFRPVGYTAWLPPFQRHVLVQRVLHEH